MATETVPLEASSDSIEQPWWLRALVRAALALLAFGALSFAADRFTAFLMGGAANSRYSGWVWLTWAGATIVAGLLFGLATLLPFANVRFMPSRLVLAAVALLPVSQFGWLFLRSHGAGHLFWFDAAHIQFSLAALAGVAIASAFTDDPEPRATGWLRVLVRAVLVLLAFWALWFAMDRFAAFFTMAARMTSVATIATGPSFDYPVWLLVVVRPSPPASCSGWRPGCPSPGSASCRAGSCWRRRHSCRSPISGGPSSRDRRRASCRGACTGSTSRSRSSS